MLQPSLLYPEISAYSQHSLQVDHLHSLYVEESGNPNGLPVLFIHGGPGGGCQPIHRQFFDPKQYRIILFDQRGCGRSRPHACLTNNTTAHLIEDIEKIRRHLEIDEWLLFGGSWGSTLALLYAQAYPERILGLILRGIFLCRDEDISWFYQAGASNIYPDYWQDFIAPIESGQQHNMIAAYYKVLTSEDEVARMRAAEAWSVWEGRTSNLVTNKDTINHFAEPFVALAMARIECHYFYHQAFIEQNQILDNMLTLKNTPITIIHGRHDMVCPIKQAYDLQQTAKHAKMVICESAGHSAFEPDISRALIIETDLFAETYQP
jgi:proline iminopeptidase